ncbi:hypothetical protein JW926_14860 [Candidatus Sumerlaeota bacterium]|nr:hypothetical protein [Candidatus Sumerlaeota bacterium]
MKLLVIVMNDRDLVADVISALVELDVRGVIALESESVMLFLAQEVPIFAGLRELITSPKSYNKTMLGVTDNENILDDLYDMLKQIGIDLKIPNMGYAFTIPIDKAIMESLEE